MCFGWSRRVIAQIRHPKLQLNQPRIGETKTNVRITYCQGICKSNPIQPEP